jgi:hypothetical protein
VGNGTASVLSRGRRPTVCLLGCVLLVSADTSLLAQVRFRWRPCSAQPRPPTDGCVRPSPGVYGCLCGSCAEVRGSTGLHGVRRRASDGQTPRSEALFAVWQVQDSNLRRHTPTDLQNDDAHAMTCRFTTPPLNFRTDSSRPQHLSRDTRSDGGRGHHKSRSEGGACFSAPEKLLPGRASAQSRLSGRPRGVRGSSSRQAWSRPR